MSDNQNESGMQGFSAAEETVVDRRLYKKTITIATIEATPERAVVAKRSVLLCRITGFLRDTKVETTPDKPDQHFLALVGDIIAVVYDDHGEIVSEHAAPQCYLPSGWHEGTLAMLEKAREVGMSEIPMDWEFAAAPASNPRGYRYLGRNLLEIPKDNSLARLMARGDRVREGHELPDFRSEQKRIAAD